MTLADYRSLIESKIPDAVLGADEASSPLALFIHPEKILEVCETLHVNEQTYFDSLSCLTGIDNGPEKNTMEVIYTLYSIPYNLHLTLKCELDRTHPTIPSVTSIWKTADWHEREAFDLVGIHFENHPDLRRILLPSDWEGHPLQKDYKEQEKYHGIHVAYDRES